MFSFNNMCNIYLICNIQHIFRIFAKYFLRNAKKNLNVFFAYNDFQLLWFFWWFLSSIFRIFAKYFFRNL